MPKETSTNFFVYSNPFIKKEDFRNLPSPLVEDYEFFLDLLSVNPYSPESLLDDEFGDYDLIASHDLDQPSRPLFGLRSLEIVYLGEHYRAIYKIDDRPDIMRVILYSYDRHHSAYTKATDRFRGRH